jgi:hypothetical protein
MGIPFVKSEALMLGIVAVIGVVASLAHGWLFSLADLFPEKVLFQTLITGKMTLILGLRNPYRTRGKPIPPGESIDPESRSFFQ